MRTSTAIIDDQGKLNNFAIEPKVYIDEQAIALASLLMRNAQRSFSNDWFCFSNSIRSIHRTWHCWCFGKSIKTNFL